MQLPIKVVAARGIPYSPQSNRLQSLNIYLPATPENLGLVGKPVTSLPGSEKLQVAPKYHVHVHGGAWRDPHLSALSVEPAVALAFESGRSPEGVEAIIGLNYTLTQFPTHPDSPYDLEQHGHSDRAREAVHPQHVHDVLSGLVLLQSLGLTDRSYVLTSHSCGACISFQAILQEPLAYGITEIAEVSVPAAMVGLNGLYDLPSLIDDLGTSHAALSGDYKTMLINAFGPDKNAWAVASASRFDPAAMAIRVEDGKVPRLVILDQSIDDQLVPMNQIEMLQENLRKVTGMTVVRGKRASGYHALPWESGEILWESVQDAFGLLRSHSA